jgi:hypothetical protein
VIEGPAEKAGIRLEGGLTEALRQDTGPEALPLLAFALRELADRYAIDKVLTLDEYRNEFGGLARSVAHAAEAVDEAKKLSVQEEEVLRRAFRSMVRVDEKGAYVRQRTNRKSLAISFPFQNGSQGSRTLAVAAEHATDPSRIMSVWTQ